MRWPGERCGFPRHADTFRLPLVLAFIGGLALFVAGFLIAAEIRSADASPAAATTGSGCYTNWNGNTCSAGYTAVETGVWTVTEGGYSGGTICAAEKAQNTSNAAWPLAYTRYGISSHPVDREPCATCCAVTTGAVGGSIDLFPSISDSPSHNYAIAAALAVVAVVAFAAGGWYGSRRWLG